jgi:hypothetical protein
MAVFIEARTEPFEAARQEMALEMRSGARGAIPVRRPVRGYQAKPNTYAVIRVMGPDGKFMSVIDAAGEEVDVDTASGRTKQYTNFFISSISEQRHEKQQIIETFGDSWIYFFGEAPRMWNVQGQLLNTADFNWRAEWWENYERYFRGTRLVEAGARLYLMYDDVIIEGYMVNAAAQETSSPSPQVLPFSFQMFITGYSNISDIGDPNFPTNANYLDYAQLTGYDRAIQNWQKGRNLQKELYTGVVQGAQASASRGRMPLGTGKVLSSTLRTNILNAGTPSISAFVSRAARALMPTHPKVKYNFFTANQDTRTAPYRGRFADNIDEYIGLPDEKTAIELANPLSMADRWLEMDRQVDSGLVDMIIDGVNITAGIFDVMGRAGRAAASIRREGGRRNSGQRVNRGMLVGRGQRSRQKRNPRDKPFGMKVTAGSMS